VRDREDLHGGPPRGGDRAFRQRGPLLRAVHLGVGRPNGYRNRLWRSELAHPANETGPEITVSHDPPGTSKFNKVEHRLFSFIAINSRGRPLTSYRTIVELAGATTTATGLTVRAEWDDAVYEKGIKSSDKKLAALPIEYADWHGEWNYTVKPEAGHAST
jgi:hypothetical protein